MQQSVPYYIQKLKEDFSQKQRRSPMYSLRAYARDLGVHAATISMVFNGKRGLPYDKCSQIVDKLALGPKERTLFIESLNHGKSALDAIKVEESDERFMLDESYFSVISEWEHYAVLTLFDIEDFEPHAHIISARLGITQNRAEVVLNNLVTCGLLTHGENGLEKSHSRVRTTEDVTSIALRKGHIETLEMGKEKIESVSVEERDFSSIMVALDPEKLPEVKTIIREFRQKLATLVKDGHRSEVYQLAIQLYPITKTNNERGLS
jgi:uncharacterized protein (TIGR02147 family)